MHHDSAGSQVAFVVRVANLIIYTLLFVAAIVFMVTKKSWINVIVSLYLILFALTLVILELRKMPSFMAEIIKSEMGFFLHPKGRMVFTGAVSLLLFGEGDFGIAVACLLLALMAVNGLVLWKFPEDYLSTYDSSYDDSYAASSSEGTFSAPPMSEESKYRNPTDGAEADDDLPIGGTEV